MLCAPNTCRTTQLLPSPRAGRHRITSGEVSLKPPLASTGTSDLVSRVGRFVPWPLSYPVSPNPGVRNKSFDSLDVLESMGPSVKHHDRTALGSPSTTRLRKRDVAIYYAREVRVEE